MRRNGLGSAHGKIILAGEHAVVYGQPAIAIPFREADIKVELIESPGPFEIVSTVFQGSLDQLPSKLAAVKKAIIISSQTIKLPLENLSLKIESRIPVSRGMGSSAAIAVAIIRAFFNFSGLEISSPQLLDLVAIAEKIAHGNPSGLDAFVTSHPFPVRFVRGQEPQPIDLAMDAYLLIGDTGIEGSTKEAVATIAEELALAPHGEVYEKIQSIGQEVNDIQRALEEGNRTLLGQKMTLNHQLLQDLQVSSVELDRAVDYCLSQGALGAKLTGGGRGGCMIALFETKDQSQRVGQEMLDQGLIKQFWTSKLTREDIND